MRKILFFLLISLFAFAASVSAKTGDGIVLYAVGLAGAAVAAGAVALLARKKRDAGR